MLFKIVQENKLVGFTFYPLLENLFGAFSLFMAILVPIIFFKVNGFKTEQWDEWIYVFVFFVFFGLLGYFIGYQNMRVEIKDNVIHLMQDMREPAVMLDIKLDDWLGVTREIKEEKNEKFYCIYIKTNTDTKYFYQTKSLKEANVIGDTLVKIYNNKIGEENGTK